MSCRPSRQLVVFSTTQFPFKAIRRAEKRRRRKGENERAEKKLAKIRNKGISALLKLPTYLTYYLCMYVQAHAAHKSCCDQNNKPTLSLSLTSTNARTHTLVCCQHSTSYSRLFPSFLPSSSFFLSLSHTLCVCLYFISPASPLCTLFFPQLSLGCRRFSS